MNMQSKRWLPDAIGVCALVAGLVMLVAVAAAGDSIGRIVTALIGGGFAFGVLGCVLRETVARGSDKRRGAVRGTPQEGYTAALATVVAMPPLADATASEYDASEAPAFAPVLSLTEAQVQRQRAERQRQEHRAALTRA